MTVSQKRRDLDPEEDKLQCSVGGVVANLANLQAVQCGGVAYCQALYCPNQQFSFKKYSIARFVLLYSSLLITLLPSMFGLVLTARLQCRAGCWIFPPYGKQRSGL